jgi:hypothetical protein
MELIVKVRVEKEEARADIAAQPRVRSCKSLPRADHSRGNTPLNLGKRAAFPWAARIRALTFSSDERESAPISQAVIPDGVGVVSIIEEKY